VLSLGNRRKGAPHRSPLAWEVPGLPAPPLYMCHAVNYQYLASTSSVL
jgi:hypothetical protein